MKHVILFILCVFFTYTTFSQKTTIHDIKPLPQNITQEYVDSSAERYQIKFVQDKKNVKIYVNGRYVTTENIKSLKEYCKQLIDFTTPNKGIIIKLNDSKGKNSNMIGRINERISVISVRVVDKNNQVYPLVMSVDRLNTIYQGLLTL